MYSYEIKPELRKILEKLKKKDPLMYRRILKKIDEIIQEPHLDMGWLNEGFDYSKRRHSWTKNGKDIPLLISDLDVSNVTIK